MINFWSNPHAKPQTAQLETILNDKNHTTWCNFFVSETVFFLVLSCQDHIPQGASKLNTTQPVSGAILSLAALFFFVQVDFVSFTLGRKLGNILKSSQEKPMHTISFLSNDPD